MGGSHFCRRLDCLIELAIERTIKLKINRAVVGRVLGVAVAETCSGKETQSELGKADQCLHDSANRFLGLLFDIGLYFKPEFREFLIAFRGSIARRGLLIPFEAKVNK